MAESTPASTTGEPSPGGHFRGAVAAPFKKSQDSTRGQRPRSQAAGAKPVHATGLDADERHRMFLRDFAEPVPIRPFRGAGDSMLQLRQREAERRARAPTTDSVPALPAPGEPCTTMPPMANIYDFLVRDITARWNARESKYPRKIVLTPDPMNVLNESRRLGRSALGEAQSVIDTTFLGVPHEEEPIAPGMLIALDGTQVAVGAS